MKTIDITNIGPVAKLSIPVPEEGGIVVLTGRNGAGKSKAIEAIESAVTGRGRIEVKDGQLRGELDCFGVNIKVARSTRRTGELEVHSLDGKLSVADLVDPGIKSPGAADDRRIKALVQLAGAKPDLAAFYPLLGSREAFDAAVQIDPSDPSDFSALSDVVSLADKVKRSLEAAARTEEGQAQTADGRARGAKEAADGVDLEAEHDAEKLQGNLEAWIAEDSKLRNQKIANSQAVEAQRIAREKIAAAGEAGSVADAERKVATADEAFLQKRKLVDALEEQLREARHEMQIAEQQFNAAHESLDAAVGHAESIKEWQEYLAASIPPAPSETELAECSQNLTTARAAVETGTLIRAAKRHLAESEQHATAADLHRERATKLRDAAKATDIVLSDAVAPLGTPLRVEAGRLVLDTPSRGVTPFGELSAGERWKIALNVAIDAVGTGGMFTIPQEAWEGLDPDNRRAVAEHVTGKGVVVLTAECNGNAEVGAEVFAVGAV